MILGMEIGMLIAGIVALITGKLTLTKTRMVHGTKARLLAIPLLLPMPMAFCLGIAATLVLMVYGLDPRSRSLQWVYTLVELGPILLCLGLLYGIGWNLAEPPSVETYSGLPTNRR